MQALLRTERGVRRRRTGWQAGASAFALMTVCVQAQAQTAAQASASPPEYRIEFRAGQVDLDTKLNELELSDDVVVKVDRYRLTSERLSLTRGPRGIVVDGEGRVAFCRCPEAPVSIGFTSATVAPPTDLLIEQPTVYVGEVPVFWLPYFWLRSKNRLGLLPPKIAYRGGDGLLMGGGVHVPLGQAKGKPPRLVLDLEAAAYLKGGIDSSVSIGAEDLTARVRFDHLKQSLLLVDSRAAFHEASGTLAWNIDAVRGERGRTGALALEPAARRYDRAVVSAGGASGLYFFGLGASATTMRGTPLDTVDAYGPQLHIGISEAIGEVGSFSLQAGTRSIASDGETLSLLQQKGSVDFSARPGPVLWTLELAEQVGVLSVPAGTDALTLLSARSRISLPLRRRFGGAGTWSHWVEPMAEAGAVAVPERDPRWVAAEMPDQLVHGSAGIKTSLGHWAARSGAELRVSGGALSPGTENFEPAVRARVSSTFPAFSALAEGAWASEERAFVLSRFRLGSQTGPHVGGSAEGRFEQDPLLSRWLAREAPLVPRFGYLDRAGLTLGANAGSPLTRWLALAAAADYHVDARRVLGVRGSVAYRHPCGCISAVLWAGHRLGRQNADVWLTLDLVPR